MQYYLDIFLKGLPALLILFCIITVVFLVISRTKIAQEKCLNKRLLEYLACKDDVLDEFRKIRHEYNNILQTVTCFIEEEDFDSLIKYENELLEKTHLLNRSDLAQLARIKDISVLTTVYKLFVKAKESGKALNLTIYNDITEIGPYKSELYNLLQDYLNHAYRTAINSGASKISLKISANKMDLRFCFECLNSDSLNALTSEQIKSNRYYKIVNNIFYNSFIQKDQLIQEILISF